MRRLSRRGAVAGLAAGGAAAVLALFQRASACEAIGPTLSAEISPLRIGGRLAYVPADGQVWVLNGDTMARVSDQPNLRAHGPRWSPDGREIAYLAHPADQRLSDAGRRDDLYVVAADGGCPRRITRRGEPMGDLHWLPNGDGLLYQTRAGIGSLYEGFRIHRVTPDGEVTTAPSATSIPYFDQVAAALSPDGSRLAYILIAYGTAMQVFLVVTDSRGTDGRRVADFTRGRSRPFALAWRPDGSGIAYAAGSSVRESGPDGADRGTVVELAGRDAALAPPASLGPRRIRASPRGGHRWWRRRLVQVPADRGRRRPGDRTGHPRRDANLARSGPVERQRPGHPFHDRTGCRLGSAPHPVRRGPRRLEPGNGADD